MAKATREAYGDAIAKLVQENPKVVVLDADLAGSTKSGNAKKVAPERFFDLGIAEANMIGTAAGIATSGYIPFASTFAMFATGRAWEQIRNSLVYPHLNVKVIGTHAGISVGEDGVSHQAIEDIALMRAIPEMEVYCPCDELATHKVIEHVSKTKKPCYVRLGRHKVENVYAMDQELDVTKAQVLKKGENIAIFATGLMVQSALGARNMLLEDGINPTVVDVCSLKPLDEETIKEVLKTHKVIVTCEEHNIIGGLADAVALVSTKYEPRIIHRIGLQDQFAESAEASKLLAKYQLDAKGVYEQIKTFIDGDSCGVSGC